MPFATSTSRGEGPLDYASRRSDPHLRGQTRETAFAAITLAVGVGFCGVGLLWIAAMLKYVVEAGRYRDFSITACVLLALASTLFLVAGRGVMRASWRIIARREGHEVPGLFGRPVEKDSPSGCAVAFLAAVMLLGSLGMGLVAVFVLAMAIAHNEYDVALAVALFLAGCGVTMFVAVLLLRLRV